MFAVEGVKVLFTDLQTGVGPVVVGAVLARDASRRATLALVPETHPPLLGLLKDLDLRLSHWRVERRMETISEVTGRGRDGAVGKEGGDANAEQVKLLQR